MESLNDLAELGAVGIALLVVLMLVDFIRRKLNWDSPQARTCPVIVECPNKVEGLDATLREVSSQSVAQTRVMTAMLQLLEHNKSGIDRLVDQHKPNVDGRETWKIPQRMETLQEESRDLLRELLTEARKNGGSHGKI